MSESVEENIDTTWREFFEMLKDQLEQNPELADDPAEFEVAERPLDDGGKILDLINEEHRIVAIISPEHADRITDLEQQLSKTLPEWTEDQLAYNGESRPQSRLLTPRERDILTRILRGLRYRLFQIAGWEQGKTTLIRTEHLDVTDIAWARLDLGEVETILAMIEIITPREDE